MIALLVCGGFLSVVFFCAPVILRHDRDTSVWYLSSLAKEKWSQFESLPADTERSRKQELLEEAANCLKRAREIRPDSHYYQWFEALVLRTLAKTKEPADRAAEAESLCLVQQLWEHPGGKTQKTARFLADYYLTHGKVDRASPYIEFLLDLDPGDVLVYDGLIQASIRLGDLQAALQALERKSQSTHLTPEDHQLLAVLAIQTGEYGKAINSLETALEKGGETTERWFLYGIALLAKGDFEAAKIAFGVYKEAVGPAAPFPSAESMGLMKFPEDLLPALQQTYQAALPSRERFR